jgi:hypothetical protein
VFRNGQLLLNDQYNLSDTNKITIVSTSFKIGANYTVATVSGIGSVGTGVFPNPVYPEAGIAVSTGTTWTTSITNNSSNWNTAFSDRLKWDGGSTGLTASTGRASLGGTTIGQSMFTLSNPSSITFPRFNANNSVSSLTASEFRTAIGAGTGTVTSVTVASGTPLSINNNNTVPEISMAAATSSVPGYLTSADWTTFNGKQNLLSNASTEVNGILTAANFNIFNNKQNALNGTGFVKANNTTISYDNTSYLPLTGGTLSGALNGTTGTFTTRLGVGSIEAASVPTLFTSGSGDQEIHFTHSDNIQGRKVSLRLTNNNSGFYPYGGLIYALQGEGLNQYNRMTLGINTTEVLHLTRFSRVGIMNNSPSYTLDVNGTLGVTGAATLSSTLAVTGNITEGGYNVLTNLDTASLSSRIDGKVSLTATETIGGTKTFNNLVNITNQMTISGSVSGANILLGKNTSNNGVGDITVGTGLNLTGNILIATNPTERYYFNLGIVAGAADNSNATYDFTYGSNVFIIPTSLNGYCIDSVYIRAVGCSTCPPVAGDKDYYVGVYKASAGNRITTSGATLVGSQITMNEYDLNEVNRNDTLTTGDVWWVYLNGTYTSDMAYITAGFLVKKTCN